LIWGHLKNVTLKKQHRPQGGSPTFALRLDEAAEARENLVIQWREVCKPRRAGAIAAKRRGSRSSAADVVKMFEWWDIFYL
jgi:hypothetical protein